MDVGDGRWGVIGSGKRKAPPPVKRGGKEAALECDRPEPDLNLFQLEEVRLPAGGVITALDSVSIDGSMSRARVSMGESRRRRERRREFQLQCQILEWRVILGAGRGFRLRLARGEYRDHGEGTERVGRRV